MQFIPAVDCLPTLLDSPTWAEHLRVTIEPTVGFNLYEQVLKKRESSLYSIIQPGLRKSCGRNYSQIEIAPAQPLRMGVGKRVLSPIWRYKVECL